MNVQRNNKNNIYLPVGLKPSWETAVSDEDDLHGISESGVILQSLRQSREKWLLRTFPKFSSKNRTNKSASNPQPPPHTIQTRGRCDLEIGPHIFPETIFYEVHYLPAEASFTTSHPYQPSSARYNATEKATSSYMTTSVYSAQSTSTSTPSLSTSDAVEPDKTSAPLITSLTAVTTITPALINQVNSAASSNPILANLLQLAAAGRATPDQLKTLGLLIQSLATVETLPLTSSNSHTESQQHLNTPPRIAQIPPVKEFDLVIEFHEHPSERWLFPRGPCVYERPINGDPQSREHDALLSARIPFPGIEASLANSSEPGKDESTTTLSEPSPPQAVNFRLRNVPFAIEDTIRRWIGGPEKINEARQALQDLVPAERVYLGYRLPEGTLLSQLQSAASPQYSMKFLKQGPTVVRNPRPRRAPVQKNPDGSATRPSKTGSGDNVDAKRRRPRSSIPANPIHCITCKKTDVPLIMGGRYCRPCAENTRRQPEDTSQFISPLTHTTPSISIAGPVNNEQDKQQVPQTTTTQPTLTS